MILVTVASPLLPVAGAKKMAGSSPAMMRVGSVCDGAYPALGAGRVFGASKRWDAFFTAFCTLSKARTSI